MSKIDLYKGDCLQVMDDLIAKGIVVDAIITDPPYGTTACKWDTVIPFPEMWERLNKLIKPNGAIVLFGSEPFSSALRMSNIKNYKYDLIWDKMRGHNPGLAKIRPLPSFENIIIFNCKNNFNPQMREGKPYVDNRNKEKSCKNEHSYGFGKKWTPIKNDGTRYPLSIISIMKTNQKGQHPTQKPAALMEYLIKTYTKENETVLDFTMGSGTTGVACENLNRNFIGIEMNDKYFDISEKRIKDVQLSKGLF